MKLGGIICKPVRRFRRKLRTAKTTEKSLSKEHLFKDADAMSVASEDFSVAAFEEFSVASAPTSSSSAGIHYGNILSKEEKIDSLLDYDCEDFLSRSDRCFSYSERSARTPRRYGNLLPQEEKTDSLVDYGY